jgi:hypothetical protein
MRNGSAGGHIGLTSLYGLQDVQVIQDVLDATIVGQPIEERSDRLLCLHRHPPSLGTCRHRQSSASGLGIWCRHRPAISLHDNVQYLELRYLTA